MYIQLGGISLLHFELYKIANGHKSQHTLVCNKKLIFNFYSKSLIILHYFTCI